MAKRAPVKHTKPRAVDLVVVAGEHATTLGHKTCRVGRTFDCWHCDASGLVGPDGTRIGDIFERSCK